MDSLLQSQSEQAFNRKCPLHPYMNCDMILVDPNVNQHRICSKCMAERKIFEKVISIPELINQNSSSYLPFELFSNDENLEKLINSESNLENVYDSVKKSYTLLLNSIEIAINKKMEEDCSKIQSLIAERKQSQITLQKTFCKERMKQLLQSRDDNSESVLHEYIVHNFESSLKESQEIISRQERSKLIESTVSTESTQFVQQQILDLIQTINMFNKQNIREEEKKEEERPLIIVKKWDLNTITCLPISKFSSSQNLSIKNENSTIIVNSIASNYGHSPQCYLNKQLEKDKMYIISVKLNNQRETVPAFLLGLEYLDNPQQTNLYAKSVVYSELGSQNIKKIIKGQFVHSKPGIRQIGEKKLEFRIFLKEKFFRVSSPPNYENVCELEDTNMIDPIKAYCFSICIEYPGDSVTFESVNEVSFFNNDM